MIALDTNLVLRLLLNDDPRQSRQAQAIVDRAVDLGESVLLPDIVLCEVEWVLSSTYNLSRARIASPKLCVAFLKEPNSHSSTTPP